MSSFGVILFLLKGISVSASFRKKIKNKILSFLKTRDDFLLHRTIPEPKAIYEIINQSPHLKHTLTVPDNLIISLRKN